jgi:AcrR family transcriptional regulator
MRRSQIIGAALACFARHGFHKTTMQDIVKRSGLSPGAIYCHFGGKQDIILAIVKERHGRGRELLQRAARHDSFGSAIDELVKHFVAVLGNAEERTWRRLTVQLWAESLHDRRLAHAVHRGVDEPRTILADLVRRAKSCGELPAGLDDEATARLLIAVFQGLVLQQAWDASVDPTASAHALTTLIAAQKRNEPRQGGRTKVRFP